MNGKICGGVRYALMTCALSVIGGSVVFAQSIPSSSAADQGSNSATAQLGKIEVTGTRIKRSSVETAQPITIVTAKQIRESGLATVADVLQNLPQAGASLTHESEIQGKDAATSINLRYFGSSRVLVLVNGKRWTPGLNGAVDLTAIPASMIDHIEILQDGASAIYGSDAITGVVNIITVKNFNGAEAHAYIGMYDNDYDGVSGWDGKAQQYDFTVGKSGNKWGIVVNAQYQEEDPVWSEDRAQSKEVIWTQGAPKPGSNTVGFFSIESPLLAGKQFGEVGCSAKGICDFGFDSSPNDNPTVGDFVNSDRVDYNTVAQITGLQENQSIYFRTHYDLADNLTFTSTAAYNLHTSTMVLNATPGSYGLGGRYTASGTPVGIGANNPYNPFGVDLVANESQYCPTGNTLGGKAVSSCTPNYLLPVYDRILWEQGSRYNENHVATQTFRMGLNGFFDVLGNEWDWDAGYSYGNVYSSQNSEGVNEPSQIATQFDSPGFPQCNGPAQSSPGATGTWQEINGKYYQILTPGCVPMNPFGGYNADTGQGSITPEMSAYNVVHDLATAGVTQRDYTADLTSSLAQLPAGPLAFAAGAEYLEDDGFQQPDNLALQGDVTSSGGANSTGRLWTEAEYVEFNIPLLSNAPLAKSLSIDLANRWSQFSWKGGEPGTPNAGVMERANATTGRAQMRWQPTSSLLLRGSWSQGFRAPSLSDLYSGETQGFVVLQDPCAPDTQNGGWNPATPLPAGCHGVVHTQPDNELRQTSGGNPDLRPETAISRSAGFVYSPNWLPGFDVGADYYKIDVNNTIGSVGYTYTMDQCYISNNPQYCRFITTAGNIITNINATNANIGETYSDGVDFNADFTFPSTAIGEFRLSTVWTFVRSFVTVVPDANSPSGFGSIEQAGYATDQIPKARGQLGINWNMGNWSAIWQVQYIGHIFERCSATTIAMNECSQPDSVYEPIGSMGKNRLGTTLYHDVAVTYDFDQINTDFTFGIRNLFNKQFPASLSAPNNSFLPEMGYRIPGRFFYVRLGVKF